MERNELLERIAADLGEASELPAVEIARRHLRLIGAGGAGADRLVRAMLRQDARFLEEPAGVWRLAPLAPPALSPPLLLLDVEVPAGGARAPWLWRVGARMWSAPETAEAGRCESGPWKVEGRERSAELVELLRWLAEMPAASEQAASLGRWLGAMERLHALPEPEATIVDLRAWERLLGAERSATREARPAGEAEEDLEARLARAGALLESVRDEAARRGLRDWQAVAQAPRLAREAARAELWSVERAFDAETLEALPEIPAVYRFLDREGRLLYVGKSKNLRRRLLSHFQPPEPGARRAAWLDAVDRFEYEETGSELAALIEEAREIRERRPLWNVQVELGASPGEPAPGERELALLLPDATLAAAVYLVSGERAASWRWSLEGLPEPSALAEALALFFDGGRAGGPFTEIPAPESPLVRRWLGWEPEEIVLLRVADFPSRESLAEALLASVEELPEPATGALEVRARAEP